MRELALRSHVLGGASPPMHRPLSGQAPLNYIKSTKEQTLIATLKGKSDLHGFYDPRILLGKYDFLGLPMTSWDFLGLPGIS